MNKFYHLLWGTFAFFVFLFVFGDYIFPDGPSVLMSLLICMVYSLLPDLDLKNSWIKQQFNKIVLYLIIMSVILYVFTGMGNLLFFIIILVAIEIILQLLKHRTILHSPLFGIILAAPLLLISYPGVSYFVGGVIGILSHWIVDYIKK
jgi:hypothetical protein